MNQIAKRLAAFAGAALLSASAIPMVHATEADALPSEYSVQEAAANHDEFIGLANWARGSVEAMDDLGLIPDTVKARSMESPITREEMCQAVVATYYVLTGTSAEDLGPSTAAFEDTSDPDVLNAYTLGIVNGRSETIFDPDSNIIRQDYFTIACNLLEALDYFYIDEIVRDLGVFSDGKDVSGYAKHPTEVVLAVEAVQGEGKYLRPKRTISSQEAMIILDRIVNFYTDWTFTLEAPAPYLGFEIIEEARKYLGYDYVYGGKKPSTGFDCSGYVSYIYKQFDISVTSSSKHQWTSIERTIKKRDLLPGDIIFFSKNGKASGIFHVGLYMGDNMLIHASNKKDGVKISDLGSDWYVDNYYGAKRVIE